MLNDLAILHRRKPRLITGLDVPTWETCLRTLAFTSPQHRPDAGDDFFVGHAAYEFLLSVICGLHSPITGETEVMGQFKIFAQAWTLREPGRISLVQRLLNDAKSIRARHLSNLGTQSYGSWLRKNTNATKMHVLGAGHLAREIVPYLRKQAEVVVHARRPTAADLGVTVRTLSEAAFDDGALIIAAPMTAAEIKDWLGGRVPDQIYDLRDDSNVDVVEGATSLAAIFAQIEVNKARLVPVVELIYAEIRLRGEKLAALEKVRPQGWDDLCA